MAKRIQYKSDTLVEYNGTIDNSDGSAITVASGGSCEARLFDNNKDSTLTADATGSQAVLTVDHVKGNQHDFQVGDACYVELDDGTYATIDILSIDEAAKTITLASNLASLASAGKSVSVLLGVAVTMGEYGTPSVPPAVDADWGWRGTIADTHADIEVGQSVRIQIELNGGAGLKSRRRIKATVEGSS